MKLNKEDAKEFNSLIDILILNLNKIYNRLVENDEMITATWIIEIFLGKDVRNRTLLEVFRLHNEMVKSRVGVDFSASTYTRYQTTFDHVSNFLLHQYEFDDILRAIVLKEKILFYAVDSTMKGPMIDLAGIRKELNAIGTNVNQITHAFHLAEPDSQKVFHALRVAEQ